MMMLFSLQKASNSADWCAAGPCEDTNLTERHT